MGRLILVLGGARSGKSDYAQALAQTLGGDRVLFVATAEARDEDMQRRIAVHRQSRPATWQTLEAPLNLGTLLSQRQSDAAVVLVDCLTLLVSNVILTLGEMPEPARAERAVWDEVKALVQACEQSMETLIVVSNEVGLGLVPDNALGRLYRDLLGKANQKLAAQAEIVYFMVSGLAVELKALARAGHDLPPS
jgi:adenosylcobinamide kinase / adenosylcobinamide-phosphate guanylyltransferase